MEYTVTVRRKGMRLNTFSKEEQECDRTIYEQRFDNVDVRKLAIFLNETAQSIDIKQSIDINETIKKLINAGELPTTEAKL